MSVINSERNMSQLLDFDGAVIGKNLSFTDIDAVMEYKNKAYVIVEVKHKQGGMSKGQQIALARMAHDLGAIKPTLLILAEHETPVDENVLLKDCRVRWMMTHRPSDTSTPTKKVQREHHTKNVMDVVRPFIEELT